MLSRMSSLELTEWMAYYKLEPFGQERGDLQAGLVAATVVNLFKDKGSKAASPADFVMEFAPQVDPKPKPADWKVHLAIAQAMAAMGYGTVTTKES